MSRLVKQCFALVLILVYVSSYMGIGVHECSAQGTKSIVLMTGDISCEAIHGHGHSHEHTCCHHGNGECCTCEVEHFHDSECCHTSVFKVTDSQSQSDDIMNNITLPEMTVAQHCSFNALFTPACKVAALIINEGPPDKVPDLPLLSVWRL